MKKQLTKVSIKPLSVNRAWMGRRFKTAFYTQYEKDLFVLLPKTASIPEGKLKLTIEVGFSRATSDLDNCVKPFIDILQKKYLFDDKRIYKLEAEKKNVKKGQEYIAFKITGQVK